MLSRFNAGLLLVGNKTSIDPLDVWKLSKGYLSVWVALSALPGYLVSAVPFSGSVAAGVFAGTALASAASQALNQIAEKAQDERMNRTKNRPLPSGRMSVETAQKLASVWGLSGLGLLTVSAGGSFAPAAIAFSTIMLYVRVYTPLKTLSCYNTHVGAVAGSLPVMIGFAAAGGFPILLSPEPWVLLAMQTLWQFPHFYPLAWIHKKDYSAGGYKMFPLEDETGEKTAKMCFPYMLALTALPFASSALGATSWMFPISGTVVNVVWGKQWYDFYKNPTKMTAKKYFLGSLVYLISAMGLYVVHLKDVEGKPCWRDRLKTRMASLCVHEREANDSSIPSSLCPLVKKD
jgi:protoheme IX farnesyltransferase